MGMGGCSGFSGINSTQEKESVVFKDTFDNDFKNWWTEGSEKVSVNDGRLHIIANGGPETKDEFCTFWCKKPFFGKHITVEFDAYVVESKSDVNNINFFLCYTNPGEKSIYETRDLRISGKYSLYHNLNSYIFTYLNDVAGESETSSGIPTQLSHLGG